VTVSARSRLVRAVTAALGVLLVTGGTQLGTMVAPPAAGAQENPPSPPTTENGLQQLLQTLFPTTTTAPPPTAAPAGGPIDAQSPGAPQPVPTPPEAAPSDSVPPGTVPPDAQALIDSIQRTGGRSTSELMSMLRQLEEVGYTEAEAAQMGMGHFPLAGEAAWSDDFLFPRYTPSFHLHQGNDVFAARGTPVRAPDDGTVRFGEEPVGGKAAYVTRSDGTYYYMAHLDGFADIPSGSSVKTGTIVGYCGDTGDAQGGATHVHFEVHPGGGAAIDPKPILDKWLDDAMAAAPALLASFKVNLPHALLSTGQLRRFDQFESLTPGTQVGTLLSTSALSAPGSALRLAELHAADAAGNVDWDRLAGDQHATTEDWQQAQDVSRSLLARVTPPAVAKLLVSGSS
jgi:murein DD-endopeptidase MepM/ murein hydrolase activator NlpD